MLQHLYQKLVYLSLILFLTGCTDTPSVIRPQAKNYAKPLSGLLKKERYNTQTIWVRIYKSKRILQLLDGDKVIKEYPVVLGFDPVHDKRREGDGCTPEGHFSVRAKYPHAKWTYFLWVSYPTADSWKKHKEAKASGKIDADDTIGGEIGIHGVPEGKDHWIDNVDDWTLGCVSLKNKDIAEVYKALPVGAKIEIIH